MDKRVFQMTSVALSLRSVYTDSYYKLGMSDPITLILGRDMVKFYILKKKMGR